MNGDLLWLFWGYQSCNTMSFEQKALTKIKKPLHFHASAITDPRGVDIPLLLALF